VTGMSCTGCEESVETGLSRLPGVRRASADHETDTVEVVVDDEVTDGMLAEAVRAAGYDVPD